MGHRPENPCRPEASRARLPLRAGRVRLHPALPRRPPARAPSIGRYPVAAPDRRPPGPAHPRLPLPHRGRGPPGQPRTHPGRGGAGRLDEGVRPLDGPLLPIDRGHLPAGGRGDRRQPPLSHREIPGTRGARAGARRPGRQASVGSPALPSAIHDIRAACGHGLVDALAAAGIPCRTDTAYRGAEGTVRTPTGAGGRLSPPASRRSTDPARRSAPSSSRPSPPSRPGASWASSAVRPSGAPASSRPSSACIRPAQTEDGKRSLKRSYSALCIQVHSSDSPTALS